MFGTWIYSDLKEILSGKVAVKAVAIAQILYFLTLGLDDKRQRDDIKQSILTDMLIMQTVFFLYLYCVRISPCTTRF